MAERLELQGDPADVAFFEQMMYGHLPRTFVRVMRHVPSAPRCRLCHAPYGGVGGRVMRRFGFGPSRKNPGLCNTCFERAPLGGVEMEVGVLFADVRGFTTLAERMPPGEVAALLNRFYSTATDVLTRAGIIDKLVGDEVMALYLPPLAGRHWEDVLVRDARDLLAAGGFGDAEAPWLPLGVGLDVGPAWVGNVGHGDVKDFTALGDVVNTASRLQGCAAAGEIVLSERLFARLHAPPADAVAGSFALKGKEEPERTRTISLAPAASPPAARASRRTAPTGGR